MSNATNVTLKAPNFKRAVFDIIGNAPLVIRRMSSKYNDEQRDKIQTGKAASAKKTRVAQDINQIYNDARYISREGWDGFHAAAIRNAMIRACSLDNYKMTLAKMSIFVIADGVDATAPQIPLIRILGCLPVMQEDVARMKDGNPNLTFRPAYHGWNAKVNIRWDADQFTLADISNLMMRVGMQVGIGEGRPSSKDSNGMGWGTFDLGGAS